MSQRVYITTCPVEDCLGTMQATVVRSLDVSLEVLPDGTYKVADFRTSPLHGNDPDSYDWGNDRVSVYCSNDHEIKNWRI